MDDKQSVSAPLLGPQPQPTSPAPFHRRPSRRALCLGLAALAAIGVVSLLLLRSLSALRRPPADPTHPFGLSSHIARNLGLYSPWQPATASDYTVPRGCVVTQVNVLQRHGSRFPTVDAAARIAGALEHLRTAERFDGPLAFFPRYEYRLESELLVPSGVRESYVAGAQVMQRYASLARKDAPRPFVRTTSKRRVVDSAYAWISGLADMSGRRVIPEGPLIISDAPGSNNSIHNSCPGTDYGPMRDALSTWESVWAQPIADRLNKLAPGATLTAFDVPQLVALCAFETVSTERVSEWCDVFEADEFVGMEYEHDLYVSYANGYGNRLGPVQGAGYANELVARLSGRPVNDRTTTNSTLDRDNATFPFDRPLYADFTHDMLIGSVLSALGLFNDNDGKGADAHAADPRRTWIASRMMPFAGRLHVERLDCAGRSEPSVRALVNDAVQPMPFCGSDDHGLCSLSAFVASQSYARDRAPADWARCLAV